MQTNCQALAKVVINKRLNTLRIVFTFDHFNRITVKNAAYVTGDICAVDYANADAELTKAIANAKTILRTDNVQLV